MIIKASFLPSLLMFAISASALAATPAEMLEMTPPEPVRDLPVLRPIYLPNTGGSIVNTVATTSNDALMESTHAYQRKLSSLGDSYLSTNEVEVAERAGLFLVKWAKLEALTGPKEEHSESDVNRYMFLSATAMNYLKVKTVLSAGDQQIIEKWLVQLAARNRESSIYLKTTGNLRSWYALGILATGIATNRDDLIAEAKEKYTIATSLINEDGTIDTELARKHRALMYTDGAIIPLVIMAELSRKIHQDWYDINPGRVDRVQERVLFGIKNPEWFVQRAGGADQDLITPGCWLIFYALRHPDNQDARDALEKQWGAYQSRIGGSTTVLVKSRFFDPS